MVTVESRVRQMVATVWRSLVVLLLLPSLGHAWGRQGHMTVALVAEGLLTPAAKQMVDELRRAPGWETLKPGDSRYFRKADEELIQFCQGPDGDLSLVGDWADAWREHHPDTGMYHYVDTPLNSDGSQAAVEKACEGQTYLKGGFNLQGLCVVSQLGRFGPWVGDVDENKLKRLEYLLWVVHLVGDIHQPLHCADNGDKGGNGVPVVLLSKRGNLHWAWDTGFFNVEHARPADLAADLLAHECKDVVAAGSVDSKTPWAWAEESFGVAKDFVYPQVRRNGGRFTRAEVDLAWPVVRRQLARAGVRLAAVLNAAAR